jgi:hypothetical protein
LTDPYRVLFREGRLPPPEGFYKVLEVEVAADITVASRVVVTPRPNSENVSFNTRFELNADVASALRHLVTQTYSFPFSPTVDVFERIVTPGAEEMASSLLDEAKITDPLERKLSQKALEDHVIPAHEVKGHIESNLTPEKCFWEPQLIWSFLVECVQAPTRVAFQDYCDQWDDDILTQSCIVGEAHEVYALTRDEEAWRSFLDQAKSGDTFSNLKTLVRAKQSSTAVKLLNLLIQKSGGDIRTVNKIIDETCLEGNSNFSYSLPHMLRDLNRGIDIDDIPDHLLKETERKFIGRYTSKELETMIQEQRDAQERIARDPRTRGLLSTYISLSAQESTLNLEVHSAENSVFSINAIPFIASLQEARRILQSRGSEVVVSPVLSMETILRRWLEYLANGREYNQQEQFDVMKDLRRFYDLWKPAITEARRRIFKSGS